MIGAGQLARMTCQAAASLDIRFRVLARSVGESAARVCAETRLGDHASLDDLLSFAAGCDVVTFDHEHVPGPLVDALERAGARVRPRAGALRYAQDKQVMRERLGVLGIGCPLWAPVASAAEVSVFAERAGWPVVLKAAQGGYDGRGVWECHTEGEAAGLFGHGLRMLAEQRVSFSRELAALVARAPGGQAAAYPLVETVQRDGICTEVIAPAPGLPGTVATEAMRLALTIAAELDVTGLLAVELFLTSDGLLVNELAMRPHNSGHWTIDGARTSQFEQHLRAVLGLPLGSPAPTAPCTAMANVLGSAAGDASLGARLAHVLAADPGARVHLYGKQARPGRKIGHVTVSGDCVASCRERARKAAEYLSTGREAQT
jgi:5-(carboxyamino)imidazole ribonucleotide synthase